MTDASDNNWLDGQAIACPTCELPLWRVVHSPFYDNWFFYCDRCPKRAEVSFYDGEVRAIYDAFIAEGANAFQSERMYREIESRLVPCECGGRFRKSADRRCHKCQTIVIAGADTVGMNVWPHWPDADPEELSPEHEREFAKFEAAFVKTDNLWRREP